MRYSVKAAITVTLIGSLTACAGIEDRQNTVAGTGIGAAVGAILGRAVARDKKQGGRLGAIVGAGIGAAVGNQLDEQENALKNAMAGSGGMIQNTGDQLVVTLPEAITFDVDSTALRPRFVDDLRALAANLQDYPNSDVRIVGHTDNTGTVSHNQRLSEGRADAVARVLINAGVSGGRIVTLGDGEFSPVASNGTAAGRQQNRRVVITITPRSTI